MNLNLAITEFAVPSPRMGSLETYSGLSNGNIVGNEIHHKIQLQRNIKCESYQSEVTVFHVFKCKYFNLKINGRMDGLYNREQIEIEEIKSVFDIQKSEETLKKDPYTHPFTLQLLTYGYIFWLKSNQLPKLNLLLVSSRNQKQISIPLTLQVNEYEDWLRRRLLEISNELKTIQKISKNRQNIAAKIVFPYPSYRSSQKEMIEFINEGFLKSKNSLIEAPTGIGKTMSVLYPSLINAFLKGQNIIYTTPKNSQHLVAEEAIKDISKNGVGINVHSIQSKKKLCLKSETICNSVYCEFAKDYYNKMNDYNLIKKYANRSLLTHKKLQSIGKKFKVCPYELQMDLVKFKDIIICDYNYIISPHISLKKILHAMISKKNKPHLIIDEVHNLPTRSIDNFSSHISETVINLLIESNATTDKRFRGKVNDLLKKGLIFLNKLKPFNFKTAAIITISKIDILILITEINDLLIKYLESNVEISENDSMMAYSRYLNNFSDTLDIAELNGNKFYMSLHPQPLALKISCCDASFHLKKVYPEFGQIIAFSATLKPFNFYMKLCGLEMTKTQTAEFSSNFLKQNRKILVIPQVSTKYLNRAKSYSKIAQIISKVSQLKKGNYIIFFPSFDYLEKVYNLVSDSYFNIYIQKPRMSSKDINTILRNLKNASQQHLIFAVQGGSLSEGVDYPGNMLIGAIIIGPALPHYNWEREYIKQYYESEYGEGYNYAYVYPAMAKTIQSAGRVIRSEHDKGIIILVDNRFIEDSFSRCMPLGWFDSKPQEMISSKILSDISEFWKNFEISNNSNDNK